MTNIVVTVIAVLAGTLMCFEGYLYAAAAFTGIFFLISLAVGISSSKEEPQMAQETTIYSDERDRLAAAG